MMLTLLHRMLSWIDSKIVIVLDRRSVRRKLKAFPKGSRVLLGGCGCARGFAGRWGTVTGLDSYEVDYRVEVDGDVWEHDVHFPTLSGKQKYQLICGKGMKR